MVEVKFKKTTSTNLESVPVSDGQIVAVTDTGELHIDFNGARTKYGGGSEVDLSKNSVKIGEETSSSTDSVVVGYGASTAYLGGVAVGKEATVISQYGLALGNKAKVDTNADFAISIGDKAKATHKGAIQLGFGTSKEDYSLSVGLGSTDNENHLLLRSNGFIPDERLSGNISRSDHTHDAYALKSEIPTDYLTQDDLSKVEAKADNALQQIESLEIPDETDFVTVQAYANRFNSDNLYLAHGSSAGGSYGISIGKDAKCGSAFSIAIGYGADSNNADASGLNQNYKYSTAIGCYAKTRANNAIQLGRGTNSTENTFSVGFSSSNNYRLLNSDGKIPIERIPDGVGGNSWKWEELEDTALESLVLDNIVTVFKNDLVSADFSSISVDGEILYTGQSVLHFHSGTTATAVTCGNVKFIGLHCYAGTFTPQKNTYYTVTLYYNGGQYVASVGGYAG